jgi:predicted metal-dependent hydrolase
MASIPEGAEDLEVVSTTSLSTTFSSASTSARTDCLEYIVVHEMTHHLERNHGTHFTKLMDRFMPNWHVLRDQLNESPPSRGDLAVATGYPS